MKQAFALLKILDEVFPYIGMKLGFQGLHSIILSKDKDNAIDIFVWHLGCAWPVTATLDEFEVSISGLSESEPATRPKNEPELRELVGKMKTEIEALVAKRLSQTPPAPVPPQPTPLAAPPT